jgi:hypothetical protein
MNERFAVEPSACCSPMELKFLLEKFGPEAGRYILECPLEKWQRLIEKHIETWGTIAQARARLLLDIARNSYAIIEEKDLDFCGRQSWIENVRAIQATPRRFDGVVVGEAHGDGFSTVEELTLPPTAARSVLAQAKEYSQAASVLLRRAPELHFIDPYIDPCDPACRNVLWEMLSVAAVGKCQIVHLWTRAVFLRRSNRTASMLQEELQDIVASTRFFAPRKLFLHAFNDSRSQTKVHDRFLLSLQGAIRFEHGFQELTGGRLAKLSPESKIIRDELVRIFIENRHGIHISMNLQVSCSRPVQR